MPRQVDHEQRRAEIADAVLRIAARRGLGGVTMSEVAQEAAVSKGRVQHYFASKEELLLHSGRRLSERVQARLVPQMPLGDPIDVLRTLLYAMLPTTAAAREDSLAGQALFVIALNDPQLKRQYRQGIVGLRAIVAKLLQAGGIEQDPSEGRAIQLLALAGYVGESILLGDLTATAARRMINDQLARHQSTRS